MNRTLPPVEQSPLFVEALEQRIAPAGLLNESKFTSVVAGGTLLLDASDPNGFQGLSTGFGANAGSYLLYITAGKALIYTTDLNGNGILDANEITGIAVGKDSQGRSLDMIAFTNINGDIVTNLLPGVGVSSLTDSDSNPNNGRDGRVLLDNGIHSITLRSLTASDIDTTIPGNTVNNRLAPTNYSIFGNIYTGGDFGAAGAGLTIDNSGSSLVSGRFGFDPGTPQIGDILAGTAAGNQHFRFTISSGADTQGTLIPFAPKAGEHGADIIGVHSANSDVAFDIGTLAAGSGGLNARGGNLSEIVLRGDRGGYQLLAGDGGQGATGAVGGSIINFADLGSTTSQVILHTGNGGTGLLGAGGAGGTATFANASIAANLHVVLGDGGNGFTAGGAGSGQTNATFTPPEGGGSTAGHIMGTYHAPGDLGNLHPTGMSAAGEVLYGPSVLDFNGDGVGDAVFTTTNPDQIVIVFGDPNNPGAFSDNTGLSFNALNLPPSRTIYLDAPGLVGRAITVGDFNGDGRLDIAAASSDVANAAGISVFLNQIGDSVHNPVGGKLYTGNPLGDHPFSNALRSPLPITVGGYGGANPIWTLAAGDFNGDGIVDIAAAYDTIFTSNPTHYGSITILFGDTSPNPTTGVAQANGYFYANPAGVGQGSLIQTVVNATSNTGTVNENLILKATSLVAGAGAPDVLMYSTINSRSFFQTSVIADPTTHVPLGAGLGVTTFALGQVDTNRNTGANATALQFVTLQDFSLQDINGDGVVDLVAVSRQPTLFITTYNGANGFAYASTPGSNDNLGIRLPDGTNTVAGVIPTDENPTSGVHDGRFNQIAIITIAGGDPGYTQIISLQDANGNPDFYAGGGVPAAGTLVLGARFGDAAQTVDTPATFDAYYAQLVDPTTNTPIASPLTRYSAISLQNLTATVRAQFLDFYDSANVLTFERFLTDNGVRVNGGRGGDSIAGVAGAGGTIGSATPAISDTTGSIRVVVPNYVEYQGFISFIAGGGGNGFAGGGAGGDVQGINVRYKTNATVLSSDGQLVAGSGGNGIGGGGGRGGNLTQFSVQSLSYFTAGDGGSGLRGGQGGSILGNQTGIYDVQNTDVTAVAGIGGLGALAGGLGGNISQFDAMFIPFVDGTGGSLLYISGNGGNAVSGIGGNGGSIVNSSPDPTVDRISVNLGLQSGNGGNGLTGGSGGSITNFLNQPTSIISVPAQLVVIAGNGGIGVNSQGGAGGSITNVRSNTVGQVGPLVTLTRILAGNGGASFGDAGGAGGSINSVTAQSTAGPIVAVAGAGGDGVTLGGVGGSVTNSVINSAAQTLGKVLIIAGAGGDATGAAPADIVLADNSNTGDLAHAILAIGGVSGVAGDGGNITNFTQPVSVQTAVDLIAGNGGSTLSYGTTLSGSTGVGKGGSITNAVLTGTVGASSPDPNTGANPPIRSYIDADNNGADDTDINGRTLRIADFVQNSLAGTLDINGIFIPSTDAGAVFQLTNAVGNVGIVAGVSGQVKGFQPARDGVNGSVQNITAGSIMSIIAGSVNSVSPVATVSGISVRNLDGVFGADKSQLADGLNGNPNNVVEYYDPSSGRVVSNLQPGFRLIDGAIFTQSNPSSIQGPRVFVFNQG